MTRDQIKAIALARGFTERQQADGSKDLNGYVYAFADAMYAEGQRAMQERAAAVCDEHAIQVAIFKAAVNEDGGPAFRHCCLDTASGAMDSAAEEIRDLEVKPS